jgi:hypothetical protein
MRRPALFDERMGVIRHIRVNQLDLSASARLAEQQDQNRVGVASSPALGAPGLDDHPMRHDQQGASLVPAVEGRERGADFPADQHSAADRRPVFFRVEVNLEQFPRRRRECDLLVDDLHRVSSAEGEG